MNSQAVCVSDGCVRPAGQLDAMDRWTPLKHGLFPAETKARVVELLQLGYQLRQRTGLVFDVWLGEIMPSIVRLEAKAGH